MSCHVTLLMIIMQCFCFHIYHPIVTVSFAYRTPDSAVTDIKENIQSFLLLARNLVVREGDGLKTSEIIWKQCSRRIAQGTQLCRYIKQLPDYPDSFRKIISPPCFSLKADYSKATYILLPYNPLYKIIITTTYTHYPVFSLRNVFLI